MTIYWSGLRSFHSQLGFYKITDIVTFEPVLNRVESDVMSPPVTYHLTMSVLPFFELKYTMIIARAILIYIYIISVVCYGTVKLWLWDKAVCRSSFNMCLRVWGTSAPVCSCPSLIPVKPWWLYMPTPFTNYEKSGKCTEWWRRLEGMVQRWLQ